MLVAYDSRTGNVKKFVDKLGMNAVQIDERLQLEEPFVLVTYTTGFGQIPDKVSAFLQKNHRWLRGVSASGNRNWGPAFAKSADLVSNQYGVPVVCKFELSGMSRDVELFRQGVSTVAAY